jgi:putative addiction module component (TIGR02574 family)
MVEKHMANGPGSQVHCRAPIALSRIPGSDSHSRDYGNIVSPMRKRWRLAKNLDKMSVLDFNSDMTLAEIPQLKSASPAEKLALIDELWASIPLEKLPIQKSHLAELNRRVIAVKKDPRRALTPTEARKQIRQKTGL